MSTLFPSLSGTSPFATGSSSQAPSSLFTKPTSSSTTTASLFSKPEQPQQPQQSQPSLFPSLAQSTGATSTSLFATSGLSTNQQPTNGSTIGASQPSNTTNQLGFSSQASNLRPSAQTQPVGPVQSGPLQSALDTPLRPALFDDLLERGKKRAADSDSTFSSLPSLQLGLGDISSKVRVLKAGADADRSGLKFNDAGRNLSYSSGALPRLSVNRDLIELSTHAGPSFENGSSSGLDTGVDIESFVANLAVKSSRDLISEALEQTKRDFDFYLEDHAQMDWEDQRRRIYTHLGLSRVEDAESGPSHSASRRPFGRSSKRSKDTTNLERSSTKFQPGSTNAALSVLGGSISRRRVAGNTSLFTDVADKSSSQLGSAALDDPHRRLKQDKYASKVRMLNQSRIQEIAFPVIEQFADVELNSGADVPKHLIDALKALKSIVKEDKSALLSSEPGSVRVRQYAADYLDPSTNSARSISLRKQIIDGSRAFLEQEFISRLEDTIARNPREANVGGVPSHINKIRAFIRLRASRKDLGADNLELQMLGDDYCWVLIFYLLRSGNVKGAAEYVSQNERAIKSMDRNFPLYMTSYARDPEHRLPRDQQIRINSEYLQRSRLAPENAVDPYKMACFKIIGRCDVGRRSLDGIETSIEDFLWLTFSLAREVNRVEESAGEVFGLDEIQGVVQDISQRHFGPANEAGLNYSTLVLMQTLAGMFENAVAWLYTHNYVTAVHFAIALNFYGLLRVSAFDSSASELLSYSTRDKPQINFARLLGYYTRDFRIANAESATDYLSLIALNAEGQDPLNLSQAAVCQEALKELVLETREFALLLGDIRSDGRRIAGAIEQRLPLISLKDRGDFLQSLTVQAASVAEDGGRITDAVLLYHLAEDFDRVVIVVNNALSDSLAVTPGAQPMRLEPLKPRAAATVSPETQSSSMGSVDNGSLSMTAVDDPVILARNFLGLYNTNASYFSKIKANNREAGELLLRIAAARDLVYGGKWPEALDAMASLEMLPLSARGNINVIRSYAQGLNSMQPTVARNIGSLLVWAVECCGRWRNEMRNGAWVAPAKEELARELLAKAKDCMVFAGLVRYKLGPDVFDILARAGQDQ